jgi:maltooligosyltrehalose trehalohydrolase
MGDGATLSLLANLSDRDVTGPKVTSNGTRIWGNEVDGNCPPWSVLWRIG